MPHKSLNRLPSMLSLITGQPGIGYESVIKAISGLGYKAKMGDTHGYRTSPLLNNEWLYDLGSIAGMIAENEFRPNPLRYISMGGSSAPALLTLPWRNVFVLTDVPVKEYMRRANEFRKGVGLPPKDLKSWEHALVESRKNFITNSHFSPTRVHVIRATKSPLAIAKEIIAINDKLDPYKPMDPDYSEFTVPIVREEALSKPLFMIVGGNGAGKSSVTAGLRSEIANAVTGDRMALIGMNLLTGQPWDKPETPSNRVDWDFIEKRKPIIDDSILKYFTVIGGSHCVLETKRPIVKIGLLPVYHKWLAAISSRDLWLQSNYKPDGGHIISYPQVVAKAMNGDFIVKQNYDGVAVADTLAIIDMLWEDPSLLEMFLT